MKGWYWKGKVRAVFDYADSQPEASLEINGAYFHESEAEPGLPRAGETFYLVPEAVFDRLVALDKEETPGPQYSSDGTLIGWVPSAEHPLPEFFPEPHWQPEWGKDPRQTGPRQA